MLEIVVTLQQAVERAVHPLQSANSEEAANAWMQQLIAEEEQMKAKAVAKKAKKTRQKAGK